MCVQQGPQEELPAAAPFLQAELAQEALVEDALHSAVLQNAAPSAFSHRCKRPVLIPLLPLCVMGSPQLSTCLSGLMTC